jgi:hypothetical protein
MATVTTGTLQNIHTLKDRTIKATFELQEMAASELADLIQYQSKYVKIAISDENVSSDAFDALDDIEVSCESKSPSQRLRNVLYRYWEQNESELDTFEVFYRSQMEKIINHFKDKLT